MQAVGSPAIPWSFCCDLLPCFLDLTQCGHSRVTYRVTLFRFSCILIQVGIKQVIRPPWLHVKVFQNLFDLIILKNLGSHLQGIENFNKINYSAVFQRCNASTVFSKINTTTSETQVSIINCIFREGNRDTELCHHCPRWQPRSPHSGPFF